MNTIERDARPQNQIEKDAYTVFNALDTLTDSAATVSDCLKISDRAADLAMRLDEIGRRARLKADALCNQMAEMQR